MSSFSNMANSLPTRLAAIRECGFVTWASGNGLSCEFKAQFDTEHIPVLGIRHVRLWGIQVDDERELPGHERTSIPDEELWQVVLKAKDGSSYEVNSKLVVPVER